MKSFSETNLNVGKKIFILKICSSQHKKDQCNRIKEINISCGYSVITGSLNGSGIL